MLLSKRLFQLMLLAYPREFRLEYGPDMAQVFCDCYRETQSQGFVTSTTFWLRTICDVIRTAPLERLDTLGRDSAMKNLKVNVIGLLACLVVIVVAFLLLGYGRRHEVASILLFGHALDAIVTAGIISNLIIFPLVMATRLSPFWTALWSLVIVNGALLLMAILIGSRVDPQFSFSRVSIGYVVSFILWLGIHWIWSQTKNTTEPVA
jgi:hypothetical protein